MTEGEMFLVSFQRPSNYFLLSGDTQWDTDKRLGILDWNGGCNHNDHQLCDTCKREFIAHYKMGVKYWD